tara:strand:+ start:319 stop:1041 length:723 start_codon:yes stop_codon:yes gene_type:complete
MAYFNNLPNILYQSPLPDKSSTGDIIEIKNIFRGSKLFDYLKDNVTLFNKYVIEDGERPDTIAQEVYGSSKYDYVVILTAGITNIVDEWPLQDYQMYELALSKYGSETKMNEIHHYETQEIRDSNDKQILPPNLIVDDTFKIDGSSLRFGGNRFKIISEQGHSQLDDKDEYTISTDNIAIPITNYQFEIRKNEERRNINILRQSYLQVFINDLRDVLRYSRSSSYVSGKLATTDITNITS